MREKLKCMLLFGVVGAMASYSYGDTDCTGVGDSACGAGVCLTDQGVACPGGVAASLCKCTDLDANMVCEVVGSPGNVVEVAPGDVVVVECFIEILNDFELGGLQIDFACNLPGGVSGSIGGAVMSVDAPHGAFPGDNTFGFTGLYPTNAGTCVIGNAPGAGLPNTFGVAGDKLYMGTATYTVSANAAGDFPVVLENRSDPTTATDSTRIRHGDGSLVTFTYKGLVLTIPTGTCCFGATCNAGPVSQADCEVNIGGTWNPGAQTCADATPCACTSDSGCDDGDACTQNICDFGAIPSPGLGLCDFTQATVCDDGNACTGDTCDPASGCVFTDNPAIDDGLACTIDDCDTATGAITNTPVDIDDGLDCTIDACAEPSGAITHDDINGVACPGGFGDCPQGAFECIGGFCTCSECSPVTLDVVGGVKNSCFNAGEKVTVNVEFPGSAPSSVIAGGSFRLLYDPTCMSFNSASAAPEFDCTTVADCPAGYTSCDPVPGEARSVCVGINPWTSMIVAPDVDEVNGVIFLAVGVPLNLVHGKGSFLPGTMASVSFTKIGTCNWCDVCFDDVNPQHTRLTTSKGDQIDLCNKNGCSGQLHDLGVTTLTCPGDVQMNSDCDAVTASADWMAAAASDTCDGSIGVGCTCTHDPPTVCTSTGERCNRLEEATDSCGPGGAGVCVQKFDPIDCNNLASVGGTFPQGRFNFSCTATPSADQPCSQEESCEWTVTVTDQTTLDVVVQLSPNVSNKAFDRCVCFELYTSCSPTKFEDSCHTMTFGGAFDIQGHSTGSVKVPKSGNVVCVTARDRQHSLRSKDDVMCDGVSYSAVYKGDPELGGNWLIQGNLNRDDLIDILDFGTFLGQLNQNPNPGQDKACEDNNGMGNTHADLNGDGVVDVSDFTFIQINFLDKTANPCCAGSGTGSVGDVARSSISVEELIEMGLEDMVVADLNNDGVVDTADMASYLEGARPAAGKRLQGRFSSPGRVRR